MTETESKPPRIVIAMDFSDEIVSAIREAAGSAYRVERHFPDVPDSVWADTEVLYTGRVFPTPEQAPRLRWIQLHSAGIERSLSQPIVRAEDVEVTSASGMHAVNMAEFALGMILAFNYKIPTMLEYQGRAEWPPRQYEIYSPRTLRGKTLGIAGYGSIGRELARIASQMGMTVLATKRDVKRTDDTAGYAEPGTGDPTGDIPERIYPGEALASMAKDCDYLVILTPMTDNTRHLVNEAVLHAMKPTGVLVNLARGPVVDEAALISALAARKIGGAALDVFEEEPLPATSPLWNLDNVIISPHISGFTVDYHEKAATLFIENLNRYLQKQPLFNRLERDRGY